MKLFGFTIIRTKKFNDIELRKWCANRILSDYHYRADANIEILYRYIKNGDTSIFQEFKEFMEWKNGKNESVNAKEKSLKATQ